MDNIKGWSLKEPYYFCGLCNEMYSFSLSNVPFCCESCHFADISFFMSMEEGPSKQEDLSPKKGKKENNYYVKSPQFLRFRCDYCGEYAALLPEYSDCCPNCNSYNSLRRLKNASSFDTY